ncbi:MAG: hypothetical protein ACQGVK_18010 [Myxococcota bacterium]
MTRPRPGSTRRPRAAFAAAALGLCAACAGTDTRPAARAPTADAPGPIAVVPRTFDECRAHGGELEPPARGGRCFARFPKHRDLSAYAACRAAGGSQRPQGPARSASSDSHVCTLVFTPGE